MTITPSQLTMLIDAIEIADSSARSHIECSCTAAGGNPVDGWQWDTSTADAADQPIIAQELRYLEARGLLIRKADAPHVVGFREA